MKLVFFSEAGMSRRLQVILSIALGVGLATLFARICRGNGCVIVKPSDAERGKTSEKM